MATGANLGVYFIRELVAGVTPESPAFNPIGVAQIALKRSQPPIESERLRDDRMSSPSVNGVVEVSGDLSTELVFGEQDELLAGVMGGAWATNKLKIGKANPSFTILERLDGVAGKKWRIYKGVVVNTLELTMEAGAIVKAKYGFVGMDGGLLEEPPTGATFGAPTSNISMTAMHGGITLDGVSLSTCTSLSLSVDNGAASRPVVGSHYSLPITQRTCKVTGSATLYYENSDLAEKAQTEDRIAVSFTVDDGTGNSYVFDATKVKPSDAWPEISGPEDITMDVSLSFDPDNTTGTNIAITRVPKAGK